MSEGFGSLIYSTCLRATRPIAGGGEEGELGDVVPQGGMLRPNRAPACLRAERGLNPHGGSAQSVMAHQ